MTETAARKAWMSLLAKAPMPALQSAWDALDTRPDFTWLRAPETGAVMVRGRAGATGAPFNMGEMTVTRCTLKLETGEVGHAYVAGRDPEKARIAATVDAMMQGPESGRVAETVLTPLETAASNAARNRAAEADATRVDFFTMVRGEA